MAIAARKGGGSATLRRRRGGLRVGLRARWRAPSRCQKGAWRLGAGWRGGRAAGGRRRDLDEGGEGTRLGQQRRHRQGPIVVRPARRIEGAGPSARRADHAATDNANAWVADGDGRWAGGVDGRGRLAGQAGRGASQLGTRGANEAATAASDAVTRGRAKGDRPRRHPRLDGQSGRRGTGRHAGRVGRSAQASVGTADPSVRAVGHRVGSVAVGGLAKATERAKGGAAARVGVDELRGWRQRHRGSDGMAHPKVVVGALLDVEAVLLLLLLLLMLLLLMLLLLLLLLDRRRRPSTDRPGWRRPAGPRGAAVAPTAPRRRVPLLNGPGEVLEGLARCGGTAAALRGGRRRTGRGRGRVGGAGDGPAEH